MSTIYSSVDFWRKCLKNMFFGSNASKLLLKPISFVTILISIVFYPRVQFLRSGVQLDQSVEGHQYPKLGRLRGGTYKKDRPKIFSNGALTFSKWQNHMITLPKHVFMCTTSFLTPIETFPQNNIFWKSTTHFGRGRFVQTTPKYMATQCWKTLKLRVWNPNFGVSTPHKSPMK